MKNHRKGEEFVTRFRTVVDRTIQQVVVRLFESRMVEILMWKAQRFIMIYIVDADYELLLSGNVMSDLSLSCGTGGDKQILQPNTAFTCMMHAL